MACIATSSTGKSMRSLRFAALPLASVQTTVAKRSTLRNAVDVEMLYSSSSVGQVASQRARADSAAAAR